MEWLEGAVPRDGESPVDCVARIKSASERIVTPCGENGCVWHVWGDGPPLVLLHGNHGSWTHWIRNIPVLAQHFRLLVPDAPGLGDSDVPAHSEDEPLSMEGMADIIADGLDELIPGEPFTLTGFSYGSTLGSYMAARLGDRITSLSVIGAARLTGGRTYVTGMKSWRRLESEEERLEAHRHNLGVIMMSDVSAADDLAVYLQSINAPRARIKTHTFSRRRSLPEVFTEIKVPIKVFWGTKDVYYQPFLDNYDEQITARGLARDVDAIEGAGHWAIYEAADTMNEKLLAFYAAHP